MSLRDWEVGTGHEPESSAICSLTLGGGGGSQKSTSAPWHGQAGYLSDLYARAQNQYLNDPREFYPDKTYTPYSQEREQALSMQTQRGQYGSPEINAARGNMVDTLGGKYLDPSSNPWLQKTYDAAARPMISSFKRSVLPGTSLSQYGRGGSGAEASRQGDAYENILGRGLRDLGTDIYGGNYNRERGNQMQAMGMAPGMQQAGYRDIGALTDVGRQREDFMQRQLKDLMDRFYFGQDEPRERLAEYSGLIGQPIGTSRSTGSNWNASITAGRAGGTQ